VGNFSRGCWEEPRLCWKKNPASAPSRWRSRARLAPANKREAELVNERKKKKMHLKKV
jgi:hypothetical protein